jgi:hypothetical protein
MAQRIGATSAAVVQENSRPAPPPNHLEALNMSKRKLTTTDTPRRVGRPTDYDPAYCEQVEKFCRLGATDAEVADFFAVVESTVNLWKIKHPEFSEALKRGRVIADLEVANSLYRRATGYSSETEKIIGKGESQRVVKVKVVVEPDTTAQIFWLKNRRKAHWRDRHEHGHDVASPFKELFAQVHEATGVIPSQDQ